MDHPSVSPSIQPHWSFSLSTALRGAFREGYGFRELRSDLLAGITVGLVALPLAMALAIASGVPPQYGLYTAIVAGGLIPILGGARFNVSGPTAAFVVILAPLSAKYGIGGLMIATLLAGGFLLSMGLAGMGQLIKFIPYPVTTGFTAGIAVVIASLQVKDFLGLEFHHNPESFAERMLELVRALSTFHWPDLVIGVFTLAILMAWSRKKNGRIPGALVATVAGALAGYALSSLAGGAEVATIGSRFTYEAGGVVGKGVPALPPLFVLPWNLPGPNGEPISLTWEFLRQLIGPAFAIGILGAIESLLCAVVSDGMTGNKHNPDTELVAQGVGNLVAPFFGGFSATGAIARTAANIRAGAFSPLAGVFHALFLLASVLVLAPLLSYLPMASLAALLLMVAWNMSDIKHFSHILRIAPRSDVIVLLSCFALTVLFDMVIGVGVGVVLAAVLFMRRMVEISSAHLVEEGHPTYPTYIPRDILLYEIAGPLFFGAAEKAMSTLGNVVRKYRAVILNLASVPAMDITGLVALERIINNFRDKGTLVILTHVKPQPGRMLVRAGYKDEEGKLVFCETIEEALFVVRASALIDPEAFRHLAETVDPVE